MDREVLVKVDGVSKKFAKDLKRSLLYGLSDVATSLFGNNNKQVELRKDEFWAVQDVSFEVRRGECLGLIGHNGAGKSTLLKMLNGLITPDKGRIEMHGRVGALIELGAGFNPILTGRENIFNNAAILGFSKKEILAKFDEIVEFSEIGDYLDMPVQNYSSGMRVRLGFAVAAQLEPDILLIDEVLAVGDMRFVIKCFNKMDSLMKNTALVLVSHSMPQIARMSTQILLMSGGKSFVNTPNVSGGIGAYYKLNTTEINNFESEGEVTLQSVDVIVNNNKVDLKDSSVEINSEEGFSLKVGFNSKIALSQVNVYFVFYDTEQRGFAEIMNFPQEEFQQSFQGNFGFEAAFSKLPLTQGKYSVTIALSSNYNGITTTHFRIQNCAHIVVNSKFHGWTPIHFEPSWKLI